MVCIRLKCSIPAFRDYRIDVNLVYYDEPDPEPPRQTMGDERMDVEEEEMMG